MCVRFFLLHTAQPSVWHVSALVNTKDYVDIMLKSPLDFLSYLQQPVQISSEQHMDSLFVPLCVLHVASYPGPTPQLFNVTRKKARGGPGIRRQSRDPKDRIEVEPI